MNTILTIGIGSLFFSGATSTSNSLSQTKSLHYSIKQSSTSNTVLDYALANRLGDNFYKLYALLDLQSGWNGYSGKKFSRKTINRTLSVLKKLMVQPKLFPTGRGTVQIEYFIDDNNLIEMEISSSIISVLRIINGIENEKELKSVHSAIREMNSFIYNF